MSHTSACCCLRSWDLLDPAWETPGHILLAPYPFPNPCTLQEGCPDRAGEAGAVLSPTAWSRQRAGAIEAGRSSHSGPGTCHSLVHSLPFSESGLDTSSPRAFPKLFLPCPQSRWSLSSGGCSHHTHCPIIRELSQHLTTPIWLTWASPRQARWVSVGGKNDGREVMEQHLPGIPSA